MLNIPRPMALVACLPCLLSLVSVANVKADTADTTNPQLVNVAPNAMITTSIDGPTDTAFHKLEARWSGRITGTQNWARYNKQIGRDITIDTVYDRPISSIAVTFEQTPATGVYYPQSVEFEVNVNGTWLSLGTVKSAIPNSDPSASTQTFTIPCNDIFAHEFRIHFAVNKWVFANKLQVMADNFATPQPGQTSELPPVPTYPNAPLHVFDANDHGIHDMLLVYTGAHGSLGTWSQRDFKPMVTYVSQDGHVGGRMFDTMLFLPYSGLPNTQSAWSTYVNQLFARTTNLGALDAATAKAIQALAQLHTGNGDFKENVVIALPYPSFGTSNWGTLSGSPISFNGTTDDPNAAQARTSALEWYIQDLLTHWKNANFQHLNLVGFYWLSEQVNYANPGEADLIQESSSTVHQLGYPLFWIPSYDASGFADWSTLGFDAAWLQSHFVFMGPHAPIQRLQNAAALATQYGTGIEIELPQMAITSPVVQRQYVQSINELRQLGMHDNVSHAFYAGSKALVQASQSSNPGVRRLYDETYGVVNY